GFLVERDRRLDPHGPPERQHGAQDGADDADRARVRAALRLGDDELAANQLERLAVEHAEVDEPTVFGARPSANRERPLRHRPTLVSARGAVNASSWIHRASLL